MAKSPVLAFEGIYDVPSAARYLIAGRMSREEYPVSSRTLIRWIRSGLTLPALASIPGKDLLISFEDLVSMRVIAALRAYGVSWAKIRRAEKRLRERTGHKRPFSTEDIWTDPTGDVFSEFANTLITESRHGQLALDNIRSFLIPVSGLKFTDGVASTWEPSPLVIFDPDVQFGAPCIKGTRIPTRSIRGMVAGGDSPELVRRAYDLTEAEFDAAIDWEEKLAAA